MTIVLKTLCISDFSLGVMKKHGSASTGDDIHMNIPNDICISKLHTHCISHSYKCL